MTPDDPYAREVAALTEEFPKLRLIAKAGHGWSRWTDRFLRGVTFGGQRHYLTRYVTTIGQAIFLPDGWAQRSAVDRTIVLRHEAVHLRQFRRFGFVGMSLLYLLPILPLGLAYGRARLEWEAYAETIRATAELKGLQAAQSPSLHQHIVDQFTGPAYGWMWPFPRQLRGWIREVVRELEER